MLNTRLLAHGMMNSLHVKALSTCLVLQGKFIDHIHYEILFLQYKYKLLLKIIR